MIAYVDSSVLLRLVFGERSSLGEWSRMQRCVTSALTSVECRRALDRRRFVDAVDATELTLRRTALFKVIERCEVVDPGSEVLLRVSEPFHAPLGTLDAIHLATALLVRGRTEPPLRMATHDVALGLAARSHGLVVVGC